MGKLIERLNKQLKTEYKQDAEDCIKVYNKLKELNGDKIFQPMEIFINILITSNFPKTMHKHILSNIGKVFLKGIE